ncbi:FecR family protein [Pseudooceanicola sp. 200-1SW]|uniref:FecR family protein n=1 Tax=Pseudooceanicola sp. 200-1SW TaxID=3425949 RepID=UPI003D7F2B43
MAKREHGGPGRPLSSQDDWCLRAEARDWLTLLASGKVDLAVLSRFRQWQSSSTDHARIFEEERASLKAVTRQAAWLHPQATRRRGPDRRAVLGGALALGAVGGAAVVLPDLLTGLRADHVTGANERLSLDLPDGTRAELNTRTAVALTSGAEGRGLHLLDGEVFLDVASATGPFRLTVDGAVAQMQAGGMALRSGETGQSFLVSEGEAALRAGRQPSRDLGAGQGIDWQAGDPLGATRNIDLATRLAWRQGRVIYDQTPFGEAARDLARYLPQRVVLRPGLGPLGRVSGQFETQDARPALEALARTQGLRVRELAGVMLLIA